jgi:8-oxo-dGTP pyrophosphatase MutT (NUDIX family)
MINLNSKVDIFLLDLEKELKNSLPGMDAQKLMAPSFRIPGISYFKRKNFKKSSVLILLYPVNEVLHTVFILRALTGLHSGEISLPGGKAESIDISPEHTAIRECNEEIGVKTEHIKIIGSLTGLYVHFSNYMIYPFVGYVNYKPSFVPNKNEVEEIIEVGFNELFAEKNRMSKKLKLAFFKIHAPYYDIRGQHIWGATAMIMSELNEIVKSLDTFNKL